ncbi:TTC26 [Acanthosepion pharaonis]|uniref:Intraflagellar transport protein 56 n=1 Tax=Acanthosepion pharaonis TaxID=158019 RepID=A0A812BFW9_ACAPH|nr:TTC26 [Sepia pharaonis]
MEVLPPLPLDLYLLQEFQAMDTNNRGYLDTKQFCDLLLFLGYDRRPELIQMKMKEVDSDGDSIIREHDYVCMMSEDEDLLNGTSVLRELFKKFDKDNSGYAFTTDKQLKTLKGPVNLDIFIRFMKNLPNRTRKLREIFAIFSGNKTSMEATKEEVLMGLEQLGVQQKEKLLEEMTNSDNLVTYKDFKVSLRNILYKMMLSRAKPATGAGATTQNKDDKKRQELPKLEDFLQKRDYTGATTLLEFNRNSGQKDIDTDLWVAYCLFHLGDYKGAMEIYEKVTKRDKFIPEVWNYLACCYFLLGMYPESSEASHKGPKTGLQNRLLFHLSHKFSDENSLMDYHQNLQDILEDQLSLASIHYLRNHYQEAIDVYKRILLDNRDYLALNVYIALCYHKLDYYDVSQEVLQAYLQQYPDSAIALNLKACNHFRLYDGKAAESELKGLQEIASPSFTFARDLIKHNMVVFQGGEAALQVLPPLVDVIPEARLNLVIYYLKQDDISEAYALIKDVEPCTPQEYILKGVVNAALGQEQGTREHLKIAQQYFQLVGGSASECDTIPGRQCMASCFFLLKQFQDVLLYLNSIKSYFYNDDNFNFNYAQAKAANGNFKEAEEVFCMIQNEKLKRDYVYLSWLARCFIMNSKPRHAWELYLKMETSGESFSLLQLVANDCYKMGQFYYAAKAFHVLERLDPNPEYWEGKRGACIGVFQQVIAGREPKDHLAEILQMLGNMSNPQVELMTRTMKKWAKENKVPL